MPRGYLGDRTHDRTVELLVATNVLHRTADALIGGLVVPPVGSGSLRTQQTSGLVDTLTAYNEGDIGPGHCDDSNGDSGGKSKGRGGKRQ